MNKLTFVGIYRLNQSVVFNPYLLSWWKLGQKELALVILKEVNPGLKSRDNANRLLSAPYDWVRDVSPLITGKVN